VTGDAFQTDATVAASRKKTGAGGQGKVCPKPE